MDISVILHLRSGYYHILISVSSGFGRSPLGHWVLLEEVASHCLLVDTNLLLARERNSNLDRAPLWLLAKSDILDDVPDSYHEHADLERPTIDHHFVVFDFFLKKEIINSLFILDWDQGVTHKQSTIHLIEFVVDNGYPFGLFINNINRSLVEFKLFLGVHIQV